MCSTNEYPGQKDLVPDMNRTWHGADGGNVCNSSNQRIREKPRRSCKPPWLKLQANILTCCSKLILDKNPEIIKRLDKAGYSQSNGLAKETRKTVKHAHYKARQEGKDPRLFNPTIRDRYLDICYIYIFLCTDVIPKEPSAMLTTWY